MKRILLIISISLLLVGCGNEELIKNEELPTNVTTTTETTTTTTTQAIYNIVLNKRYVYKDKDGGSEFLFKENGKLETGAWANNGGATGYRGTYKIEGNSITMNIIEYQDVTGLWEKLPSSEKKDNSYTLTSDNTIVDEDGKTWTLE